MAPTPSKRVLVIGLDCAAPRFILGPERYDLPHLQRLMDAGSAGLLRSCHPPITVPAWACMMSGKDPGTLGIYGFRNRRDYSYEALSVFTAADVKHARVWDILSEHGSDVVVLGVPQTYPVRAVKGCMVAGLLAPSTDVQFTYPPGLAKELKREVGDYQIDVADFRTEAKSELLGRIHSLMNNRFDTARYLMDTKPWDFFMLVEMGLDRLHHAFWSHADPAHPAHRADSPFRNVVRDYYRALDARIGELCAKVGDETTVLVVSDHGAKPIFGGVCINQWLLDEGYLTLRESPKTPRPFSETDVDWPHTKAWSAGGYYARIQLNVEGREPQGSVRPDDYESLRDELAQRIEAMNGPDGTPLGNRVLKPEEIYATVNGIAPDLLVYFGDLHWRSVGLVGCDGVFAEKNDTGPDEANHDFDGIFIISPASSQGGKRLEGLSILDVAPTILDRLGLEVPGDMQGRSIA